MLWTWHICVIMRHMLSFGIFLMNYFCILFLGFFSWQIECTGNLNFLVICCNSIQKLISCFWSSSFGVFFNSERSPLLIRVLLDSTALSLLSDLIILRCFILTKYLLISHPLALHPRSSQSFFSLEPYIDLHFSFTHVSLCVWSKLNFYKFAKCSLFAAFQCTLNAMLMHHYSHFHPFCSWWKYFVI